MPPSLHPPLCILCGAAIAGTPGVHSNITDTCGVWTHNYCLIQAAANTPVTLATAAR